MKIKRPKWLVTVELTDKWAELDIAYKKKELNKEIKEVLNDAGFVVKNLKTQKVKE